jgi:LytS/YehU family sensor histidine kinase
MLNDAEKIYRNLGEEIEFVTTYLELEKLRFGEKFNYEIEIGEGVTKLEQVPKLVLQTFTENAVKHGQTNDSRGMSIELDIQKNHSGIVIITLSHGGMIQDKGKGHMPGGLFLLNQQLKSVHHPLSSVKLLQPSANRVEARMELKPVLFS